MSFKKVLLVAGLMAAIILINSGCSGFCEGTSASW